MKPDSSLGFFAKEEINVCAVVELKDGEYIHYGSWLCRPRKIENFTSEKLFIRQTSDYPVATYDNTGKLSNDTLHCILPLDIEYVP